MSLTLIINLVIVAVFVYIIFWQLIQQKLNKLNFDFHEQQQKHNKLQLDLNKIIDKRLTRLEKK